jgi:hypothetical protein
MQTTADLSTDRGVRFHQQVEVAAAIAQLHRSLARLEGKLDPSRRKRGLNFSPFLMEQLLTR